MMGGDHLRAYVFEMNKSGTQAKRICYTGYQDERPIFNLAEVKPEGKRVSVFYVSSTRSFAFLGRPAPVGSKKPTNSR